ncbi:interferon-inducible GTPase 5-like [Salminus brasiliensis]|uniref:interferon-inducible GTPase 5-like n=1 Tax=Salminus brasiliensis TaxID=930266 RepID=UPI003B8316C0
MMGNLFSKKTKEAIEDPGSAEAEQGNVDHLLNVSLTIAVTGETGAGKSTFINAYRGVDDDDKGAAETGVSETTAEPTPYQHPTLPNVVLWDLPGIGSPNFKAKTYVKEMQIDRYDFFLIISSVRFRENDLMLAKEIQKQKKKFYFIRSKIDESIRAEERMKTFNREETLSKIRADCQRNLKDLGNPPVFLISSWNLSEFDFEELVSTLNSELPEQKQFALLQSAPVTSVAMLEKKVAMFHKVILAAAIVSGGIAAAPVPGLSFACDTAMVTLFFTRCYYAFGLDDRSLEKLSERVNKPELKSREKSPLLKELVKTSVVRMGASALGEFLCSLVPGAGTGAAATISFRMTRDLLESGLKELADEARKMLREAGLK